MAAMSPHSTAVRELPRDARLDPSIVAFWLAIALVCGVLVRYALTMRWPNSAWVFDLAFFVPVPVCALWWASRKTGWSIGRLAGFSRAPSASATNAWIDGALALAITVLVIWMGMDLWPRFADELDTIFPPLVPSVKSMLQFGSNGWIVSWMYMAVSAGIVEEIIYRGLPAHRLLASSGSRPLTYVAFSSSIFAIGHLGRGLSGVTFALAVGIIFAAFFLRTRSIGWLVGAHVIIDLALFL